MENNYKNFNIGDDVTYIRKYTGVKYKGKVIEIDKDGKYLRVRNTIGNIDYLPIKEVKKMEQGGKIGDTIRIAKDMPFMASLSNLYNKDLKIVDVKDVFFASGNQKYYIVEVDGEQYEVPGRFTEKKMGKGGPLKKMAKGGYLEGREKHEGYDYQIWYNPNKRMYSVSDNNGIFKGDNNYFDKYEQAKEHAEISIRSILSDEEEMAKGGGVENEDLSDVYYYAMHRWNGLSNSVNLKAQNELNINPKGIERVLSWEEIKDKDKLRIYNWMNDNLDENDLIKYSTGGVLKGKQKNLDINKNGKIDSKDLAILRGNKMAQGGGVENEIKETKQTNCAYSIGGL